MKNSSFRLYPLAFPRIPLLPRNCKSYESRNRVTVRRGDGWEDAAIRFDAQARRPIRSAHNVPLSREKEGFMKVRGLILLFLLLASPAVYAPKTHCRRWWSLRRRLRDVEQPASQVPGKVIVVTAEEIEKLGAKTVQEVLQYQTGIVLYDAVGNEFQQTVDMRGFNAQPVTATSVFVDGVRVNEPDFNTINFDLIPIEDIERIEILPGTATVFGRNALAGVINITTKRGRKDRPHVGFNIGGGSYGRQRYSFNTDGPLPLIPNFDYYFGVTRELTNGYRDEFDSRHAGAGITRLLTKLGYRLGDNTDASLAYTRVLDSISQAGSLPASRLRVDRNDNLTPGDQSQSNLHQVALNLKQKLPDGFLGCAQRIFSAQRYRAVHSRLEQ